MRTIAITCAVLLAARFAAGAAAPCAPSPVIAGMTLDWSTHQRHALGSDNFQLTWAGDDHQYGAWGDGGGFGGANSDGRLGLGFARIEGDWDDYKGFNVWGGKDHEIPRSSRARAGARSVSKARSTRGLSRICPTRAVRATITGTSSWSGQRTRARTGSKRTGALEQHGQFKVREHFLTRPKLIDAPAGPWAKLAKSFASPPLSHRHCYSF
jgi:hypothetical protein